MHLMSGARASTAAAPSGNTAEYANMIAWQITNKLAAAIGCTLDCAIDARGRMEISSKIPGPFTHSMVKVPMCMEGVASFLKQEAPARRGERLQPQPPAELQANWPTARAWASSAAIGCRDPRAAGGPPACLPGPAGALVVRFLQHPTANPQRPPQTSRGPQGPMQQQAAQHPANHPAYHPHVSLSCGMKKACASDDRHALGLVTVSGPARNPLHQPACLTSPGRAGARGAAASSSSLLGRRFTSSGAAPWTPCAARPLRHLASGLSRHSSSVVLQNEVPQQLGRALCFKGYANEAKKLGQLMLGNQGLALPALESGSGSEVTGAAAAAVAHSAMAMGNRASGVVGAAIV